MTRQEIEKKVELIKEISGCDPYKCMKCGKCSGSCPAFNEMDVKPHQFASYIINGDIESLVNSKSLWKCLTCFACIEAARQLVERERGGDYLQAEDIPELLDDDVPQQLLVSAYRRYRR